MTAVASNDYMQETIHCWKKISPVVHEPQNADDYEKLSGFLDKLLDIVGDDECHELMGLVDVISHMIAMYDDEHYPLLENGKGIDALKFLIVQHNLKQADLNKELGSQGVISEILNGKRQLNVTQIKKLGERFK